MSEKSTPSSDLEQLQNTVATLAEALSHSERRHNHAVRMFRWGALALVSVLTLGGFIVTDRIGIAYAQNTGGLGEPDTVVAALNNINRNLSLFGMAGQSLQEALPEIENTMMKNPDVQTQVQRYVEAQGLPVTKENMKQHAVPAIVESTVTTLVDTVVLMARIREDSNAFRDIVGGPVPALEGIQTELERVNIALASVPVMAAQMDLMNRNISSMSYSVGSTMGRAGSWMPW